MGAYNLISLIKTYIKSLLISIAVILAFILLNINALAATRPVLIESSDSQTIRLSQVYFKGNSTSIPTYLPSISSPYTCESINLRNVIGEYGYSKARSSFLLHGNRDYYAQRGNPMEYVKSYWTINYQYSNVLDSIVEKEFLGGTSDLGKKNTSGYWWGVDSKPSCSDYSILAPISGFLYGDFDKSSASGGYEQNIIGSGVYSGFAVKLLHLANLDTNINNGRVVNFSNKINSVSRAYNHLHFTVMYGTGIGKIDVPFQYLIPSDSKFESYTAGSYKDFSTAVDTEILKYLEVAKYDPAKSLFGFDTQKLENTYKYLSSKTNKKVILDIGMDKPVAVNFDANGKFIGTSEITYPTAPVVVPPVTPPLNDPTIPVLTQKVELKKYNFTGTIYMYYAKEITSIVNGVNTKTYIKNGLNKKFCSPALNPVYGKRDGNNFIIFSADQQSAIGICTWYDSWIKEIK